MIKNMFDQFRYLLKDIARWKTDSLKTAFYNFFEQGIWGAVLYRFGRFLFLFDIPLIKIIFRG